MKHLWILLFLCACATGRDMSPDMVYAPVDTDVFRIATWQKITDESAPVHVYIEGDGRAFDAYGRPTGNPTPVTSVARDLASRDTSPNVVYVARPCMYVNDPRCSVHDWTDARFSSDAINSIAQAVRQIVATRPLVLIGHSGGALVTGLIINGNYDLAVQKWVTVAGVLNHGDWTEYFGDTPLSASLNLDVLPRILAAHYIAPDDTVVPNELSHRWVGDDGATVVPDAKHNNFDNLDLSGI